MKSSKESFYDSRGVIAKRDLEKLRFGLKIRPLKGSPIIEPSPNA